MAPKLPEHLCLGYCNWHQADEAVIEAVKSGVNVVIWFSIDLIKTLDGKAGVQRGPDFDEVANIIKKIREMNLDCVHLMSIGGWNSPHPDPNVSAEEAYTALDDWNRNVAARPELGFAGFDGFDWDVEGNDDFNSVYNIFDVRVLDLMGRVSQLAKADGYIMAMAPAESYLDPRTSDFSLSLAHNHREWISSQPEFNYRGRNSYAPLLAKYGTTSLSDATKVDTFDFITIQLYEGFSHAEYAIRHEKTPISVFFREMVSGLINGWQVDFTSVPALELGVTKLAVPASKLVIGLANKWAGDGKFFFLTEAELTEAHGSLTDSGLQPRGYAFWNIKDEGIDDFYMARTLNRLLSTRP